MGVRQHEGRMRVRGKNVDHIRNYFPVPNEIFRLGLSGGEILVYAYLMYCEDRTTYTCHPSYTTIGNAVGMSKRTVMKYVQMLERKGLIETEPTTVTNHEGKNWNGNLKYTIMPIQDIVDARFQRELRKADTARRLQEYDQKHPRKEAT